MRALGRRARDPEAGRGKPKKKIPKKVAVFVEPSPFTYVCGYQNRFCNLIRHLRDANTEVLVITPGRQITEDLNTSARRLNDLTTREQLNAPTQVRILRCIFSGN